MKVLMPAKCGSSPLEKVEMLRSTMLAAASTEALGLIDFLLPTG